MCGLEEALGAPEAFRRYCRDFPELDPEIDVAPFHQSHLQPAQPMDTAGEAFRDGFAGSLGAQWDWGDAFEDCSATQDGGPTIRARHGCDLRRLNRSAPRVLRAVPGDFAAQTVCSAVSDMTPAIGDLVVWMDQRNYVRLDTGALGKAQVFFLACIGGREATAGETVLPFAGSPQVGLLAVGRIDSTIYPGPHLEGTAIRFESFQLWGGVNQISRTFRGLDGPHLLAVGQAIDVCRHLRIIILRPFVLDPRVHASASIDIEPRLHTGRDAHGKTRRDPFV